MGNRRSLFPLAALHSGLAMLLTMAAPFCGYTAAPDISTPLLIKVTGAGEQRTTELNWTSVPGAIYKVQSRDALNAVTPWSTIDVVQPPGTAGLFKLTPDKMESGAEGIRRSRFFQLALPQPEIFRVEPAVLSTGGGEIYVVGQCLTTNGTLRVGGVAAPFVPGGAVLSAALLCMVPPMPPGVYDVEWLEGGVVVATAEKLVTVASVKPGDALQRQVEPPAEPPASPMKVRKGGMVNGNVVINNANRMGGKKGLNAVNVKLAFARDGGDDDLDDDGFTASASRKGYEHYMARGFSGEVVASVEDLTIPGVGLDFSWVRTYRSRTGRTTPMGHRWDHSYNLFVEQDAAGIAVNDGTGRRDVYFAGTNGIYTRDEFFNEGSLSNDSFTLTFPDTGKWLFHAFDGSAQAGKISRIEDRNGNALRFEYDDTGRLTRVIDTLDRTITIGYAGEFITSLTDFAGRTVTYQYHGARSLTGGPGDLATATSPPVTGTPNGNDFPLGKTTTYAYSKGFADARENHLLLSVTDPKGQTPYRFVYQHNQTDLEFLRVRSVTAGYDTNVLTFKYFPQTPAPDNRFATMKCIVNDAVGNVSECFYDSLNRCVRQLEYTGRAVVGITTTETENRPGGKLRKDDPDFFETRWEWNLDSLCTRVIHPRGDATEMVYQRAFNQNSSRSNNAKRHDGDLRVLRERACCLDPDDDGDSLPDGTERAWRFEYDARFGSPAIEARAGWSFNRGPRQSTSLDGFRLAAAPSSVRIIKDKETKRYGGFVGLGNDVGMNRYSMYGIMKLMTDPRGNVSTATYDDHGDLLHTETIERKSGALIAADFTYDRRGRLTSITHPADGGGCRRVDGFEFYEDPSLAGFGFLKKATVDKGGGLCGDTSHFRITTSLAYDAVGNVVRCVDPRGNDTRMVYNALDQRISMNVTVPKQTQGATFGEKVTRSFTYDANDNLVQVDHENRDQTGALDPINPLWTSSSEFDVMNRARLVAHELTHVVQQGGGGVHQRSMTNRFSYDGNGNLVLEELPESVNGNDPDNVVSFQYDERDLPFRVLAAPGTSLAATEQFDYNRNGQRARVSKVDAFSIKQTIFSHDGFGRCVKITDAMGNIDKRTYDANDNLLSSRFDGEINDVDGSANNRRLSETRYEYDSLDRCVRRRVSFFDIFTELSLTDGESTHSTVYAPNGSILSETDDNGNTTRYAYDSAGRLSGVSRGLLEAGPFEEGVQVLAYTHDAAGNVLSVTQTDRSDLGGAVQGFVTAYVYDEWNRCLSTSNNVGNVVRYARDSSDNCVSEIDERGNEVTRVFDGLGRVTDTTHYVEEKERGITINTSHVEYSTTRCVSSTDGNGNTTSYAYDSVGRLTSTTHPDKTRVSLVWSPRSNLASRTDANGTVITYTHDLLDRCIRKDIAPGADVVATTTFEEFRYDGLSQLVLGTNDTSMVEYSYDSMGNLAKAKADCIAAFATFDGEGNRLSLTYPGGRIMQSTFGRDNRLSAVGTIPFVGADVSSVATFSYDGLDRLSRIARGNGVNTRINWNGLQTPANSAGDFGWQQVARVNHARSQGGAVIDQRAFTYDRSQNKTVRAQTTGFSQGAPTTTNLFAYDALHRLTRGTRISGSVNDYSRTYVLDANGNRQQVIQDGAVSDYTMDNALPEPADFQLNQYTLTPFGAEQHDRNGNLIFRDSATGGTMYRYDYADRLVSVERAAGPAFVTIASYTYDVLGRRISKTTYPPAPSAPVTTQFIHDPDSDGDAILELRRNGTVVGTFYWLPEVDDEVLVAFTPAGASIYFHNDDLGNTLALTDQVGNVLERYDYNDYGSPRFLDSKGAPILVDGQPASASPLGNPFLFHGMFWDAETALYRDSGMGGENPMYEPKTGRYMIRGHRDVGGYRASFGASDYTFAGDNPWTGNSPGKMKKGTVKFFNDAKGFGMMADGGGGGTTRAGISTSRSNIRHGHSVMGGEDTIEVMFNPKEYSISKVTVRGWDWKQKKAEGGRHTPFHNKRTTDVTGEIELEAGRDMGAVNSNPLYEESNMSGSNPFYSRRHRPYQPGQPVYGNRSGRFSSVSNVLKTKHDTAKNSVGNIR